MTMDVDELRGMLESQPRWRVWGDLCDRLEAWPEHDDAGLRAFLEQAQGLLGTFPDEERVAPFSWFVDYVHVPPSGPREPDWSQFRGFKDRPHRAWPAARPAIREEWRAEP